MTRPPVQSSTKAAYDTGSERHPLTHPLQLISGKDLERRLRRSQRHCQYWRGAEGKTLTNFRFADDIDGLAVGGKELAKLAERLGKASTAYGMEISAEKTKLTTNSASGMDKESKVNGQKHETVTSFKWHFSKFQDATDALPCHIQLPVCLRLMDPHS